MTNKYILYIGTLNDDYATECSDKSVLLTYYTYASDRANYVHEKSFANMSDALRWYRGKFHGRVVEQGKAWIEKDTDDYYYEPLTNQTPEEYWTTVVFEQGMEI